MIDRYKTYDDISNWLDNLQVNITEEQILNLLQLQKRWPKDYQHCDNYSSVEIINYWSERVHFEYRNTLFDGNGYLDYNKLKRYYDNGFTILLSDILDLTTELRTVNEYFIDTYGTLVQGNFYLSGAETTGAPSFDCHEHMYDVFVKQIYGWSMWKVNNQEFKIEPGDVITIPMGVQHQVIDHSEKRLSLTINRQ